MVASTITTGPTFDTDEVSTLELEPIEPAEDCRNGWWVAPDSGLTSIQELARRLGMLDEDEVTQQ
jgi:hypothetical protein